MRPFRFGFLAILALAGLSLAACLESRMPLFDESKAVTPAAAGRYDEQENKSGNWVQRRSGVLTIEGKSYSWTPDGEQAGTFFTLQDIGGGFYVAAARQKNPTPKDPYTYALFEQTKDGYLAYTPNCADMMKLRLPKQDIPVVDSTDCFYTDRDALVRSLRLYAQVMLPASRYVPIKPAAK